MRAPATATSADMPPSRILSTGSGRVGCCKESFTWLYMTTLRSTGYESSKFSSSPPSSYVVVLVHQSVWPHTGAPVDFYTYDIHMPRARSFFKFYYNWMKTLEQRRRRRRHAADKVCSTCFVRLFWWANQSNRPVDRRKGSIWTVTCERTLSVELHEIYSYPTIVQVCTQKFFSYFSTKKNNIILVSSLKIRW